VNYITTYCTIKNGTVCVNGRPIFSENILFPDFAEHLYKHLSPDYPKFYKMDNLSKLGFLACEVLVKNGGVSSTIHGYDGAVVLSNSSGSLDTDSKYNEVSQKTASPAIFVYTLPNIVNGEICIRHGFKGENIFFVTPQFDTDLVCAYCDGLLEEKSKICMGGWIEIMGNEYDAFLYCVEKEPRGISIEHNPQTLKNLYCE
jgi:hypothetical protein